MGKNTQLSRESYPRTSGFVEHVDLSAFCASATGMQSVGAGGAGGVMFGFDSRKSAARFSALEAPG